MSLSLRRTCLRLLACCLTIATAQATPQAFLDPGALSFEAIPAGYSATLVVSGPQGVLYREQFATGQTPYFDAAGSPDGVYSYELRLSVVDQPAGMEVAGQRVSGTFSMRNGGVFAPPGDEGVVPNVTNTGGNHFSGAVTINSNLCAGGSACTDGLFPPQDLYVIDTEANVQLESTIPNQIWEIENDSATGNLQIDDQTNANAVVTLETGAQADAIYVDGGNFGAIGLFTSTPTNGIELTVFETSGSVPEIRLANSTQEWDLRHVASNFQIVDITAGTTPLQIDDGAPSAMLRLQDTGNIGIGTSAPDKQVHILGNDATAGGDNNSMLKIENNNAAPASRKMLELVNNGTPTMSYVDTSTGNVWTLNPTGSNFTMSKVGTGGKELTVTRLGELEMRNAGSLIFDLDKNGNVVIAGALTQNSDIHSKRDFASLDRSEILNKVDSLEITEWSYKSDHTVRHIGPMAQDFRAAFGLGVDETHISPMDAAGVALLAVQALTRQLEQKDAKIGDLEDRLARLEAHVASSN